MARWLAKRRRAATCATGTHSPQPWLVMEPPANSTTDGAPVVSPDLMVPSQKPCASPLFTIGLLAWPSAVSTASRSALKPSQPSTFHGMLAHAAAQPAPSTVHSE